MPLGETALLLAALAAITWSDWTRLRIPNAWLLAGALALGVAAAAGVHPRQVALGDAALAAGAVLALGLPLFAAGRVAAGDVKLLAVLGLLFGCTESLAFTWAFASLLAALHIAAWRVLRTRRPALPLGPRDPGPSQRLRLPHGTHLCAAAAVALHFYPAVA